MKSSKQESMNVMRFPPDTHTPLMVKAKCTNWICIIVLITLIKQCSMRYSIVDNVSQEKSRNRSPISTKLTVWRNESCISMKTSSSNFQANKKEVIYKTIERTQDSNTKLIFGARNIVLEIVHLRYWASRCIAFRHSYFYFIIQKLSWPYRLSHHFFRYFEEEWTKYMKSRNRKMTWHKSEIL